MNSISRATLTGFIRLAPDADCIGIPVFQSDKINHLLVSQTDVDLRIVRFLDFFNDQEYLICNVSHEDRDRRQYVIGDPAPIPFVMGSTPHLIQGDRHPADVDTFSRISQSSILSEIREILRKARDGTFRRQIEAWQDQRVQHLFFDVFEERPSHATYWIRRFRTAISSAVSAGQMGRSLADEFRRTGNRWLELFATKTDLFRLKLMTGSVDDPVFSSGDRAAILFGYACHAYTRRNFSLLAEIAKDPLYLSLLDGGLFYFQRDHGYPTLPFKYQRPDDGFLGELRARMYRSLNGNGALIARELAMAVFGLKDAPRELQDDIVRVRSNVYYEYKTLKEREESNQGSIAGPIPERHLLSILQKDYQELVQELKDRFRNLVEIEGIEYGNARVAPRAGDYLSDEADYIGSL